MLLGLYINFISTLDRTWQRARTPPYICYIVNSHSKKRRAGRHARIPQCILGLQITLLVLQSNILGLQCKILLLSSEFTRGLAVENLIWPARSH